jgi:hypothetical protein
MRVKSSVLLVLAMVFLLSSFHHETVPAFHAQRSIHADADPFGFDIVQRTCALEVVMETLAPDRVERIENEPDDSLMPMPLDSHPVGAQLACLPPPR